MALVSLPRLAAHACWPAITSSPAISSRPLAGLARTVRQARPLPVAQQQVPSSHQPTTPPATTTPAASLPRRSRPESPTRTPVAIHGAFPLSWRASTPRSTWWPAPRPARAHRGRCYRSLASRVVATYIYVASAACRTTGGVERRASTTDSRGQRLRHRRVRARLICLLAHLGDETRRARAPRWPERRRRGCCCCRSSWRRSPATAAAAGGGWRRPPPTGPGVPPRNLPRALAAAGEEEARASWSTCAAA
ncbi:hypothetical protein BS78_02G162900 [Paspalum vaginatum]|nr:hypothetical protein BS78_02G162900 [Paspalum vaginatum]